MFELTKILDYFRAQKNTEKSALLVRLFSLERAKKFWLTQTFPVRAIGLLSPLPLFCQLLKIFPGNSGNEDLW